jgi:hypothetical protein
VQQASFSAQHFLPALQQPCLASAVQQADAGLQHARFAAQQSGVCEAALARAVRLTQQQVFAAADFAGAVCECESSPAEAAGMISPRPMQTVASSFAVIRISP